MTNLLTAPVMPDNVVSIRSEWLTAREAVALLSVSKRTIQRRAAAGEIDRRTRVDGRSEYRVTEAVIALFDPASSPRDDTPRRVTPGDVTPRANVSRAIAVLREELAASRAETVAAERRAAVAEYRAQLSETDPAEVEALRDRIAALTEAVEEAEGVARDLAARLRKRFALIQRLTAEIGRGRSGSAD